MRNQINGFLLVFDQFYHIHKSYCISKKSSQILYNDYTMKIEQDFLDIQ